MDGCERHCPNTRLDGPLFRRRGHLCERRNWLWVLVCESFPRIFPRDFNEALHRVLTYILSCSFWSYEYCKRLTASNDDDATMTATKVLLCGGIAGIVTWASVFPLDVIKTRLQARTIELSPEHRPLMQPSAKPYTASSIQIAKEAYLNEGLKAFYRGLGVCSVRAFIVNAVQVCQPGFEIV